MITCDYRDQHEDCILPAELPVAFVTVHDDHKHIHVAMVCVKHSPAVMAANKVQS